MSISYKQHRDVIMCALLIVKWSYFLKSGLKSDSQVCDFLDIMKTLDIECKMHL